MSQFIHTIFDARTLWIGLWSGLVVLTIALLLVTRTRWGQARPISKCVVLSVLAHMLMIGYAYKTHLFSIEPHVASERPIQVTVHMGDETPQHDDLPQDVAQPWERFVLDEVSVPQQEELARGAADFRSAVIARQAPELAPDDPKLPTQSMSMATDRTEISDFPTDSTSTPRSPSAPLPIHVADAQRRESAASVEPSNHNLDRAKIPNSELTSELRSDLAESAEPRQVQEAQIQRLAEIAETRELMEIAAGKRDQMRPAEKDTSHGHQESIEPADNRSELPQIAHREPAEAVSIDDALPLKSDRGNQTDSVVAGNHTQAGQLTGSGQPLPGLYQFRTPENRIEIVQRRGGSVMTEASVNAALDWLASCQSEDGRWDTSSLGGGRENRVAGRDRDGSGVEADTGITGLVMLAFLGAGHTHLKGPHAETVQHGLEYLLRVQQYDGNLGGTARLYARMYCHGMATYAVSEAYAMTADERMRPYLERAVAHTIATQHPTDGGWRYQPGDRGDMSQFGWQVMAIKSAQLAGIEIPSSTLDGMRRFLRNTSSGQHLGLASYRASEQPSRTMTAEALVCRIFLDSDRDRLTVLEAADYLLEDLPGATQPNLYYWYYATLGLYQLDDQRWQRWNDALQRELLNRQRTDGTMAGSWDPETVWGGYGGRAYSTAMAALCLEVFYRYLPLYVEAGARQAAN